MESEESGGLVGPIKDCKQGLIFGALGGIVPTGCR